MKTSTAVLVTAVLVAIFASPVPAAPNVHLCYLSQIGSYGRQALYYVREYYPTQFPNNTAVNFTISLFGSNRNYVQRQVVESILSPSFTQCSVLIGPGLSSFAITISNILTQPLAWVDFAATSVQLSDKGTYASFSRVVPTDAYASNGVRGLLKLFNWKSAAILANDVASGRTLASASEKVIRDLGGSSTTLFLDTSATSDAISRVLASITSSGFRVVLVFLDGWTDSFVDLTKTLNNSAFARDHVMVFGESICSGTTSRALVRDGFCITYELNTTGFLNFYDRAKNASVNSNDTLYNAELIANGFSDTGENTLINIDRSEVEPYNALNIDALFHTMTTIRAAAEAAQNITGGANLIQQLRKRSSIGMTGNITLDSNGDRASARMALQYILPNGTATTFAFSSFPDTTDIVDGGYRTGLFPAGVPSDHIAAGSASTDQTTTIVVIVVVVVVAMLIVVAVVVVSLWLRSAARFAPTDEAAPFAVIVASVDHFEDLSTRLRSDFGPMLDTYTSCLQSLVRQHRCYLAAEREGGERVMVARNVLDAAALAADIHRTLYKRTWPDSAGLELFYMSMDPRSQSLPSFTSVTTSRNRERQLWNGLRVAVTVDFGCGTIDKAATGGGYVYGGQPVIMATDMQRYCHGGQTVVTEAVAQHLPEEQQHHLREVAAPDDAQKSITSESSSSGLVKRFSLPTPGLEGRRFPAMRIRTNQTLISTVTEEAATDNNARDSLTEHVMAENQRHRERQQQMRMRAEEERGAIPDNGNPLMM